MRLSTTGVGKILIVVESYGSQRFTSARLGAWHGRCGAERCSARPSL